MPVEKFVEIVRQAGYTITYLEALAKLSLETADCYQMLDNEVLAGSFYLKTLQLYYLLGEKDKMFSFEREMIITELKQLTNSN
jgi:hypothetical protein